MGLNDLAYFLAHNTDAAAAPVIFIHGAGGSHNVWRRQFDLLPDRPTYFLDLPGHGQTAGPAFADIADSGRWLNRWLTETAAKPAVLVGHSMGGAIAQWMALHAPEAVQAIVLVTTGARLKVNPAFLERLEQGAFDAEQMRMAFSPHTPEAIVREEIAHWQNGAPAEVIYSDFSACNRFDVRGDIRRIACPALIIAGEDDRMTPPAYSAYMAEQIPDARLVILQQTGHYPMLEQTERFNEALKSFIEQLDR